MTEPLLEDEQKDLLVELYDASLTVDRPQRVFATHKAWQTAGLIVSGGGLTKKIEIASSDVFEFAQAGLVKQGATDTIRGTSTFRFTPEGRAFVKKLKGRAEPAQAQEKELYSHLSDEAFGTRHPEAYRLWSEADELLQADDAHRDLTTIGLRLWEAEQAFATDLVELYQPADVDEDPEKTYNRVVAVLNRHKPGLSEAVAEALDALARFWRKSNRLVQRQKHGFQKPGEPLKHEDARRAVFLTAVAMNEIDRALVDAEPPAIWVHGPGTIGLATAERRAKS